jgi:predicted dehydrogenase
VITVRIIKRIDNRKLIIKHVTRGKADKNRSRHVIINLLIASERIGKLKIKYGLSGFGGISKIHLMGIRNIKLAEPVDFDVELSVLSTTSPSKRQEGMAVGFKNVVGDLESLLKTDVDLVDICTPNFLHKEQIIKSARAGKHIYCEKPLGMNSKETYEIVKEVSKCGAKNQIAFMIRFIPAIAYAHSILQQGLLGKVYAFRGEFFHSSYLDESKPMSWRLERSKSGGGAIADLGSHMIDLVRFLLGEFGSIQATMKTVVGQRSDGKEMKNVDVDDWALLFANLESGATGTIEVSRVATGKEGTRLEIYAEHGSIFINTDNPYTPAVFDSKSRRIYFEDSVLSNDDFYRNMVKIYPSPKLSQGFMIDAHTASLIFFFNSIAGNEMNGLPTFEDGHKVQIILDEAYDHSKIER